MDGQLITSLMNPAIGLLLAASFVLLWWHHQERSYILIAAVGYTLSMVGFVLQDIVGPRMSGDHHRVFVNLSFFLSAACLGVTLLARYRVPVPSVSYAVLVAIGCLSFCWFTYVVSDMHSRIYAVNFTLGAIVALAAWKLRMLRGGHLVDRILFSVLVIASVNFVVRPVAILWWLETYSDYSGFQQSIYWTSVQITQALISIMVALSVMAAVGLDFVRDLRVVSDTDPLSGLLTRRGFEERARRAIAQCEEMRRPVAIVVADLDHFKQINDTYGHATGDEVIAAFGAAIRSTVDDDMIVGRIGGEEFAILMPGMNRIAARRLAERIRGAMRDVENPAGMLPVTASFGITSGFGKQSLSTLIDAADKALYEAKRSGRDRVRVAPRTTRDKMVVTLSAVA